MGRLHSERAFAYQLDGWHHGPDRALGVQRGSGLGAMPAVQKPRPH
jgi:hypothetical protein